MRSDVISLSQVQLLEANGRSGLNSTACTAPDEVIIFARFLARFAHHFEVVRI
jgi:hypothetical protein